MAVLDEYILRAARLLRDSTVEDVDILCREIMDVFDLNYINPKAFAYINLSDSYRYSDGDLKIILQKLRLMRDEQDEKTFGAACCSTITQHIRRLEQALEEGLQGNELKAVYASIDHVYANAKGYESYTDGLAAYGASSNELSKEQTRLRIDKLKHFRDEEMRSTRVEPRPKEQPTTSVRTAPPQRAVPLRYPWKSSTSASTSFPMMILRMRRRRCSRVYLQTFQQRMTGREKKSYRS